MKKLFSHILSCFYFWNFKSRSFSKKRKKVAKGKKYRTPKPILAPVKKTDLIIFKDEKGTVCFSIQMEFLSYIESDTNYITIFYCKPASLIAGLRENRQKVFYGRDGRALIRSCQSREYLLRPVVGVHILIAAVDYNDAVLDALKKLVFRLGDDSERAGFEQIQIKNNGGNAKRCADRLPFMGDIQDYGGDSYYSRQQPGEKVDKKAGPGKLRGPE